MRLADVLGHDAAVSELRRAVAADRVPAALLLLGPAGVGKRTLADALATRLLCASATDDAYENSSRNAPADSFRQWRSPTAAKRTLPCERIAQPPLVACRAGSESARLDATRRVVRRLLVFPTLAGRQ